MILLVLFAFLAGIVTVLSPCILPVLPIILSSSVGGVEQGKKKPLGVVFGFVLSFSFFTLFLSTIVRYTGIPADVLRIVSFVVIGAFGVSLLIPKVQVILEQLFSRMASFMPKSQTRSGFFGGLLIGMSLGLLWTPCVGPILASVISLAITGSVNFGAVVITVAYSLGTSLPMFFIILSGQNALQKVPWLVRNTANIQKAFGVVMFLTALGIAANVDRKIQTYILTTFPKYGSGLTKFEDIDAVRNELDRLRGGDQKLVDEADMGKPSFEVLSSKGTIAPEILAGGEWFNSKPLTLKDLRGKVVVIDFWTYSCINCQRTIPYLRNWWEKYKDDGLVIIGVHSPEFEFEKNPKNVAKAILDFGITYPVVQDNDFATWRRYNNRYWPAKYFIDKEGFVRYQHFGEGAYDESEQVIQKLLKEMGANEVTDDISNPDYQNYAKTPETYLGHLRLESLSSPEALAKNITSTYSAPSKIPDNTFALEGAWTVMGEYSASKRGSKLYLNFDSKEVFLVMRPGEENSKVKVYLDGKQENLGEDVVDGVVEVKSDSLYKLIKLPAPGRHILMLEFESNDVEVYAFTFG